MTGEIIMRKYLGTSDLASRCEHSLSVAKLSYQVAQKIKQRNPELALSPEFVCFLGYVHDIGYAIHFHEHELHTVNILVSQEQIPKEIADMSMHGQLAEQRENPYYLPRGLEGMILTYADMSVRIGEPVSLQMHVKEIRKRVEANKKMSPELKEKGLATLKKAIPRFERYERLILTLAQASSIHDF